MIVQAGLRHGLQGTDHNDPLLEGEDLSHTAGHDDAILYVRLVLKRIFAGQSVAVVSDVALRFVTPQGDIFEEVYRSPDISVIPGLQVDKFYPFATYDIDRLDHLPPPLVFEIASDGTWPIDLTKKPDVYADMGIREYFTYDPNQVWTGQWRKRGRLLGWRLNALTGRPDEIPLETRFGLTGLRSEQLNCWLVVDADQKLRFYDEYGRLLLNDEEALAQELEAEQRQLGVERERAAQLELERQQLLDQLAIEQERTARLELERQQAASQLATEREHSARLVLERQQAADQLAAERQRVEELMRLVEQLKKNPGN